MRAGGAGEDGGGGGEWEWDGNDGKTGLEGGKYGKNWRKYLLFIQEWDKL